jgi:predicted ATPase
MLTKLRLKNFKNFKDAELHLGGFTVLLGTNAAGKSNIRDAMRFLNGVGRGYTLSEIIGDKFVEGGILQWHGIRGGLAEISFRQAPTFELEVDFTIGHEEEILNGTYQIEVKVDRSGAHILRESLICKGRPVFKTRYVSDELNSSDQRELFAEFPYYREREVSMIRTVSSDYPVLAQFANPEFLAEWNVQSSVPQQLMWVATKLLAKMRFLDLQPEEMRKSSTPGQTVLTDRGENLSAVVQSISANPQLKANFLNWLQSLTPMDAQDLRFLPDVTGKVLLQLMEASGHLTSAISASDGTLKFMGFLAAYLSAEPSRLLVLEELENGIHPTRLHLLLQLIEQQAQQGKIQTIATTHSPQLLRLLSEDSLKYASLIYRLDDRPDAQIQRVVDIPHFQDVLDGSDLGELLESGWLETTMSFQRDEVAIG